MASARRKLNSAAVMGILLVAGLVGGVSESWTVLWWTGGLLFLAALYRGDIRPRRNRR